MVNALNALPLGKLAYSAVILAIIGLFVKELAVVWFDNQIYVGNFQYFNDGKLDDQLTKSFPISVLAQHHMLRSALIDEARLRSAQQPQNQASVAKVYHRLPPTLPGIETWQSSLSTLELKFEGFDVGKALAQLRTWVSLSGEVGGFVERSNNITRASVTWPSALGRSGDRPPQFNIGPVTDDNSAAFAIAASIVWSQAAEVDTNFRKISRDTFVNWALAWWNYRSVLDRAAIASATSEYKPNDDDKARWKLARKLVDSIIDKADAYPEIWYLRAEIIERNPTETPSNADLVLAKDDRQKYAKAIGLPEPTAVAALQTKLAGQRAAGLSLLQPGAPLWFKFGAHGYDSAITMTAVVVDSSRHKKILLPDYVLDRADAGEVTFRLGADGPVVARASAADIVKMTTTGGHGVVLATLADGVGYDPEALVGRPPLRGVGDLPAIGEPLTLLANNSAVTGSFTASKNGLAETALQTQPGSGGAPVVDKTGQLVAMAYYGTDGGSQFLPLKPLFDSQHLTLAEGFIP